LHSLYYILFIYLLLLLLYQSVVK